MGMSAEYPLVFVSKNTGEEFRIDIPGADWIEGKLVVYGTPGEVYPDHRASFLAEEFDVIPPLTTHDNGLPSPDLSRVKTADLVAELKRRWIEIDA